jgi:LemA protein
MTGFWNVLFGLIVVALLISGLFSAINWSINLVAIAIVVVVWLGAMYNNFVRLVNRAKEAWADIDVQLKRRYDLIPNLIETVKGYAGHEKDLLENVTKARAEAISAEQSGDLAKTAQAENMLTGALRSVFAVAENYPDLKANQNFLELQKELSDTENKIQAARRFYNTNVRDLNIGVESFPANIIAKLFRFSKMNLFELEESVARDPVKVSF